eukprot:Tbor_TRINITY_DN5747_c4_g1::TRINITY_DN5747_c4_g1_i1::g.20146::m.20146
MTSLLYFIDCCADTANGAIPILAAHPQIPSIGTQFGANAKEDIPPNSRSQQPKPHIIPSPQLYYFKGQGVGKQFKREYANDKDEDDSSSQGVISWQYSVHKRLLRKISIADILIPFQDHSNNNQTDGMTVSIMHFEITGTPFIVESIVAHCSNKACRRCAYTAGDEYNTDTIPQSNEAACCPWPNMPLCRVLNTEVTVNCYESNFNQNNILSFVRSYTDASSDKSINDNNNVSLLFYFLNQSNTNEGNHKVDFNNIMFQTHIPAIPLGSHGAYVSQDNHFIIEKPLDRNGEVDSCCSIGTVSCFSGQHTDGRSSDGMTSSGSSMNTKNRTSVSPFDALSICGVSSFDPCGVNRMLCFSDPLNELCTEDLMSTVFTLPYVLPGGKAIDAMFCDMFRNYNSSREQWDMYSLIGASNSLVTQAHRSESDYPQRGQLSFMKTLPLVPLAPATSPGIPNSRRKLLDSQNGTNSSYKDKPLWFQIALEDMSERCAVYSQNDMVEGWQNWRIGPLAHIERSVIVNSIDEVCSFLLVSRQTFFASVALLDQYMAAVTPTGPQCPLLDPDSYRMVVVTLVYIASKIHDVSPPHIHKVIESLGLQVRPDVICATEIHILTNLNFMVHPLTLYDVMHYLNQLPILSLSSGRGNTVGTPRSQGVSPSSQKTESPVCPSRDGPLDMNTSASTVNAHDYPATPAHTGHNTHNYPPTPKSPITPYTSADSVRRELRNVCWLLADAVVRSDCSLYYTPLDLGVAIYNKAANFCGVSTHPRMNMVIGGYRWKTSQGVNCSKFDNNIKFDNSYIKSNQKQWNGDDTTPVRLSGNNINKRTYSDAEMEHIIHVKGHSEDASRIIYSTIRAISSDIQNVFSSIPRIFMNRYDIVFIQNIGHYITRTAREGSFVAERLGGGN